MALTRRRNPPDVTILVPADRLSFSPVLLIETLIPAGFPSPAADYVEGKLDLNDLLIPRPAATFFVQVSGESMTGAGIHSGDLAVVDRSLTAQRGDAVVAIVNGELTIKLIQWSGPPWARTDVRLVAANPDYPSIPIVDGDELTIWGVVTATIHRRRGD